MIGRGKVDYSFENGVLGNIEQISNFKLTEVNGVVGFLKMRVTLKC